MAESVEVFNAKVFISHHSMHNKCQDGIWDSWYPRLRVAVFVIFLFYYIFIIPGLFLYARKKSVRARKILSWHLYVPAVVSMILYLFLALIGDCLLNCLNIGDLKYLKLYAAVNVFRNLSSILILSTLLFPITTAMLKSAPLHHHHSQLANLVLLTIVACLMVVHVTFWDYNNIHSFTGGKLVDQRNGGPATYVTMYLISSLVFAAHIVVACHARRKNGRANMFIAPLLALTFILFSLIDMIVVMGWKVHTPQRTWTKQTSVTFGILNLFFQACVFGLVALLARSLGEEEMDRARDEKVSHRESEEMPARVGNGV